MMYAAQLVRIGDAPRVVYLSGDDALGIAHEIAKRLGKNVEYAETLADDLRFPEPAVEYVTTEDDPVGHWLIRIEAMN